MTDTPNPVNIRLTEMQAEYANLYQRMQALDAEAVQMGVSPFFLRPARPAAVGANHAS